MRMDARTRVMWWLLEGSRGGAARKKILAALLSEPQNTHKLSMVISMDYKTVEHHLRVLLENEMVTRTGHQYGAVYFVSAFAEEHSELFSGMDNRRKG